MHSTKKTPLELLHGPASAENNVRRPAFLNHFGLRESPFHGTSDPRYLLLTDHTRKALDALIDGINARAGLLVLTGEVGTGKTVLLNCLLGQLQQRETPRAFIFNSHLETDQLFEMALADFGASPDPRAHVKPGMRLNQWLFDCYRANLNPVLIVDEAQGLRVDVLEAIRMLLNLESGGEKLLQIVLSGQPELDAKINLPEMRQLRQRIAVRCRLRPLALEDTCAYIEHRLRVAGATGDSAFLPEALAAVHYYARGTPRVINALCEQALMTCCAQGSRPVQPETIEEVARQFQVDGYKPIGPPLKLGDLMMMNAVAARSKRANAMLADSSPMLPSEITSRLKPQDFHQPIERADPPSNSIRLPVVEPGPKNAAPTPVTPRAASMPASTKPPIERADPPPNSIRLPAVEPGPKNAAPTPLAPRAAGVPASTKPRIDFRGPSTPMPARPPAPKATLAKPPISNTARHAESMVQVSLRASLSTIEHIASSWLRWLREPMRSRRGPTRRGKR
jgi:general secretion pathway protein A